MKNVILLLVFLLIGCLETTPKLEEVTVARAIDGDTLVLENGGTVRLIGVNAPEKGQPGFLDAKQELELLEGEKVFLERDVVDKDRYGRLLRYVHHDGLVNEHLVKKGLASVYRTNNKKYLSELLKAETFAREEGIGIWARSNISCIHAYLHYDAEGKDEKNLNDEYVVIESSCEGPLNLTNWLLRDEITNSFIFPERVLYPGGAITLRTGKGTSNVTDVYWNRSIPVWNNDRDRLFLFDDEGKLVLFEEYGG